MFDGGLTSESGGRDGRIITLQAKSVIPEMAEIFGVKIHEAIHADLLIISRLRAHFHRNWPSVSACEY
jgi:hypothetical protein